MIPFTSMDAINVRIARISVTNLRQRVYIRQNRFTSRSLHEKSRRELSRFYFKKKEKKKSPTLDIGDSTEDRRKNHFHVTERNVCSFISSPESVTYTLPVYVYVCMYVCMYILYVIRPFLSCKVTCMCTCKCTFIAYVQRAYVRRRNASLIAYNDDRD